MDRDENPVKRTNPSGETVWVARYTNNARQRRSAGTFKTRREAKAAIRKAYEEDDTVPGEKTVRQYFETWLRDHPRKARTAESYLGRVRSVLDVRLEGSPLGAWPMSKVSRRHVKFLKTAMLVDQGRAAGGANGVFRVLSAMWENAYDDELVESNPFRKASVRRSDPRVKKAPREIHVWSFAQMHAFAAACGPGAGEASVRVLSDCGLRLGEMLPLIVEDVQGGYLRVNKTAYQRRFENGTKNDHGEPSPGRLVPLPPSTARILAQVPRVLGSNLLWPDSREKWRGRIQYERNWYRDVWEKGQAAIPEMADATPHDFRHSWVSHLRAAGINPADLAEVSGHTVETATAHYTHATNASDEAIRRAVG